MKCEYCENMFVSKSSLLMHQKRAKYCLKLRNIQQTPYQCTYCEKYYSSSESLKSHKNVCTDYFNIIKEENSSVLIYKQQLKLKDEIIQRQDHQIQKLESQIEQLQDKLEDIAIRGVQKHSTTNNQYINLLPLTDDYMKSCAENLTLDHIKDGPLGYAKYALEYPFKDRLQCSDYSRKKIKYKSDEDNIITDPQMTKLVPKFFNCIEEQNDALITECIDEIREKIDNLYEKANDELEGWDLEDLELEQTKLNTLLSFMFDAKRNVKKAIKGEDTNMSIEFVKHVVNNIMTQ